MSKLSGNLEPTPPRYESNIACDIRISLVLHPFRWLTGPYLDPSVGLYAHVIVEGVGAHLPKITNQ